MFFAFPENNELLSSRATHAHDAETKHLRATAFTRKNNFRTFKVVKY